MMCKNYDKVPSIMIIVTPHSNMLDIQGLESGPPDYKGTKTVFTLDLNLDLSLTGTTV